MGIYEVVSRLENLRREIRTRNNVFMVVFLVVFILGFFGGPVLGTLFPIVFIMLFVGCIPFAILGNKKSQEFISSSLWLQCWESFLKIRSIYGIRVLHLTQ